jgi:5-methylcytosine-specific restriction endonuclease McrA
MRRDLPCSLCGEMMWRGTGSLPEGQAMCQPCRRTINSLGRRPCVACGNPVTGQRSRQKVVYCGTVCSNRSGPSLKGRTCEACGVTYKATYPEQRTCGRECGARIQAHRPRTVYPSSHVCFAQCSECGTWFAARRRRLCCSQRCVTNRNLRSLMEKYANDPAYRDRVNTRAHARRARLLGLGDLRITLTYLVQRDAGRCGICRRLVRAKSGAMRASIDHIIPLSKGGTHTLDNVQLAHYHCNLSKGNRGEGEQLLLIG